MFYKKFDLVLPSKVTRSEKRQKFWSEVMGRCSISDLNFFVTICSHIPLLSVWLGPRETEVLSTAFKSGWNYWSASRTDACLQLTIDISVPEEVTRRSDWDCDCWLCVCVRERALSRESVWERECVYVCVITVACWDMYCSFVAFLSLYWDMPVY